MSGGVRGSSGGGQTQWSNPSSEGAGKVDQDFQSKLQEIDDPAEKERLQGLMDKVKSGKATQDEFEEIAKLLDMKPEDLSKALGTAPDTSAKTGEIQ